MAYTLREFEDDEITQEMPLRDELKEAVPSNYEPTPEERAEMEAIEAEMSLCHAAGNHEVFSDTYTNEDGCVLCGYGAK